MPVNFHFSDEDTFLQQQQAIENFYANDVVHHRIKRSESLHLSALELTPPAYEHTLVIIPGRAECEHKYAEFLWSLSNVPVRVLVLFVRGQGSSDKVIAGTQKCHIDDFDLYLDDVDYMLDFLQVEHFRLLAFSLGGLIALELYRHGRHKPERMALLAPFIFPAYDIPAPFLKALTCIMGTLPGLKYSYTPHGREYEKIPFEENHHSHSRVRYEAYHDYYARHPEVALAGPTYGFVRQCLKKQLSLLDSNFEFNIPVFCLSAGKDQVVSTPYCAQFFRKHRRDVVRPVYQNLSGAFHDLLNEADEYRRPALLRACNFLFNGMACEELPVCTCAEAELLQGSEGKKHDTSLMAAYVRHSDDSDSTYWQRKVCIIPQVCLQAETAPVAQATDTAAPAQAENSKAEKKAAAVRKVKTQARAARTKKPAGKNKLPAKARVRMAARKPAAEQNGSQA